MCHFQMELEEQERELAAMRAKGQLGVSGPSGVTSLLSINQGVDLTQVHHRQAQKAFSAKKEFARNYRGPYDPTLEKGMCLVSAWVSEHFMVCNT